VCECVTQVLCRQLLDPGYGMFKPIEESRTLWFNGDSISSPQEFELIGECGTPRHPPC
jgi:hypothetical protein